MKNKNDINNIIDSFVALADCLSVFLGMYNDCVKEQEEEQEEQEKIQEDDEYADVQCEVQEQEQEQYKEDNNVIFQKPLGNRVSIETGLELHKIINTYINDKIKPLNGDLSINELNNVYANLYDFCEWMILNKYCDIESP